MSNVYILDYYYAIDHEEFCLVIESDKTTDEIIEIAGLLELYFEHEIDEMECLSQPFLLKLLQEFYGVKDVKDVYKDRLSSFKLSESIERIGELATSHINIDKSIILIDLYEARDSCCGKYKELTEKYLPKGDRLEKLKKLINLPEAVE